MVQHAVLLETALVRAGRDHRHLPGIACRNAYGSEDRPVLDQVFALPFRRVFDAAGPGVSAGFFSQEHHVAPEVDHSPFDAVLRQIRSRPVRDKAFRDGAQVEHHAGIALQDLPLVRTGLRFDPQFIPKPHVTQTFFDRSRLRHLRFLRREIPQARDRAHRHVQHAAAERIGVPAVLQQHRCFHVHPAAALRRIEAADVAALYGAGQHVFVISGDGESFSYRIFLPVFGNLDVAVRVQQPVFAEAEYADALVLRDLRGAGAL